MDDKIDLERADAWVTELSMSRRIYGHEKVVESLASLLTAVRREERERALEEAAQAADDVRLFGGVPKEHAGWHAMACVSAAASIRAIKTKP